MLPALYRNYLISKVVYLPADSPERRKAFEALVSPAMPVLGATYPFNAQRYAFVTQQAKQLSKNMSSLTNKTRFCSRGDKCDKSVCGFAHTIEEWNPPFCLQQEFCLVPDCDKNHGLTKEEYIELRNIKVPEKKEKKSLVCTQFCRNMKEQTPCGHKGCPFAHSLWEYKAITCPLDAECTDVYCIKKHSKDSIFYYMERQGVPLALWMMRAPTYNNSEQIKRLEDESVAEYNQWIQEWSDDFRRYEGEQDLVNQFKRMTVAVASDIPIAKDSVEEEEEDEEEEDNVTFRIGTDGKNTMSLRQAVADKHFGQFETDVIELDVDVESDSESIDEDHQLSEEESASIMLAAVDLGLDFETVFDMIENGKSHIVFEWHKRRFDVGVGVGV
jgi:hypothetical protein